MSAILDWITREGHYVLAWWVLVTAAGAAVLPLCWRWLGGLPDKGYALARAVGLLLIGFVFWLLATLGLMSNSSGNMLLAASIVFGGGLAWYLNGERLDWRAYWRENRQHILMTEILFAMLLVGWAIFRAYQNDTATTEKPMDLMFISSILRSDTFPPNDAWMAGYSISYYYFGYVLAAMLGMLSGASSTITFSLMVALLAALTGVTTYGIGYNLVRSRAFREGQLWDDAAPRRVPLGIGVLAMVLVVFLGNFQFPLIELPYQSRSADNAYFDFWLTQDRSLMGESYQAVNPPFSVTNPETWSYWWYFRASRVLADHTLDGRESPSAQPIDEFPMFSFLLGDVHPHVMALPFTVLAMGLALNILLRNRAPLLSETVLYGLVIGGLIFLNTWDAPLYWAGMVGALALQKFRQEGELSARAWGALARFGLIAGIVALVAYAPFLIGFRSQAGGFLPNLLYPTYFPQFFIMFAPLLLLVSAFVLVEAWRGRQQSSLNWRFGLLVAVLTLLTLTAFLLTLTIVGSLFENMRGLVQGFVDQNGGWEVVLGGIVQRRLAYAPTALILLLLLWLIVARLFATLPRWKRDETAEPAEQRVTYAPATAFALMLVGMGVMVTLIPEFIYLSDVFGSRINTIFKFYYQAWVVWSIAAAYGVYVILLDREHLPALAVRVPYGLILGGVLLLGMLYPILGVHYRTMVETGRFARLPEEQAPLTLDGGTRMLASADDYRMVQCLADLVRGDDVVVVEAVRDAYNPNYGRVGALTGIPLLLGWENHQRQWRGGTYGQIAGSRPTDIERLYNDNRWEIAQEIITRQRIDYIIYGWTERQQYAALGEEKFIENLSVLCEFGDSKVYRAQP